MKRISAPFVLSTAGTLGLSFANVRLETGRQDVLDCATLASAQAGAAE
jgi:hypothetical protein